MREALGGARRFDDFRGRLPISDNTLSRRLAELVNREILERQPYQTGSLRVCPDRPRDGVGGCTRKLGGVGRPVDGPRSRRADTASDPGLAACRRQFLRDA